MADPQNVVDELELIDKSLTPSAVQQEVDDIIAKLKARKIEELDSVRPGDYEVSQAQHPIGIPEAFLLAFVGALAKKAAEKLWEEYIWPSLELRLKGKVRRKSR